MTDMTTDQRRPEEIERDIRDTQAEMSRTVEQIESGLNPRNLFDSLLDKSGANGVDSEYLIDVARRNPIALGMIAIGGLWLVSGVDARPGALTFSPGRSRGTSDGHDVVDSDWSSEHSRYVEHMSRCERLPGEDAQSYRRRRDDTRASYFMLEQGHDEDESAFRRRLDAATDKLRQRREKMSERAQAFAQQSRERSRQAMDGAMGFYDDNPLVSGLAAAFIGALAGAALPATRTEEAYVGSLGEQALGAAKGKAREAGNAVRQQKDKAVGRIDESIAGAAHHGQGPGGHQEGEGGSERPARFGEEA
jgi:ElaB/YqjD/DUF883 family membrane-anchored ribosome-binding protein